MPFSLLDGKFAVGAWNCPPGAKPGYPSYITDEQFLLMRDCGINLMHSNHESDASPDVLKGLELAEKYGLYYIVNDRRFIKDTISVAEAKEALKLYESYPAFAGISIWDEPQLKHLEHLGKIKRKHSSVFQKTLFYTNLYPMGVHEIGVTMRDSDVLRSTYGDYLRYLDTYIDCIKPELLSYDYYPFLGAEGVCDQDYFTNLSIIKSYADRLKVPYWCFIQIVSWHKGVIRNMTENEIRWQVVNSLAFGVKGINYFTYFTPNDTGAENFDDAMIDRNGKPTARYGYVKTVNQTVAAWGEILMECSHKGVILPERPAAPIPPEHRLKRFGGLKKVEGNVMTGCFKRGRDNVYLFANAEPLQPAKFRAKFGEGAVLTDLSTGEKFDSLQEYTLAPGAGMLIQETL